MKRTSYAAWDNNAAYALESLGGLKKSLRTASSTSTISCYSIRTGQAHRRVVIVVNSVDLRIGVEPFFDDDLVALGHCQVQRGVLLTGPPDGHGTAGGENSDFL